jgi:ribosomal subunit interface protein
MVAMESHDFMTRGSGASRGDDAKGGATIIENHVKTGAGPVPPSRGEAESPAQEAKGVSMRYQVTGKQIDIGQALRSQVEQSLGVVVEKYAGRPTDANVIFSRDAHEFVCETTIHLSTGLTAQARAHENEIYAALDKCVEKLDKQLRRYKRRLKDHHRDREQPVELMGASSYILAGSDDGDDSEPASLQPIIIAEMETTIPSLSVGEAVMQMELSGVPVLVFRNEKQESGVNIVYRRDDGNIGWIDPN